VRLWTWIGRIAYWGIWPGSWLYLRGSRRTRLLLCCGDEILVVNNWLGAGKWNLPGGGLHTAEDPELGLLRELFEETGIQLKTSDLQLLAKEPYQIHGFHYSCTYFMAIVTEKPPSRRRRPEITEIMWSPRTRISPKNHGPDIIRALQLLDSK
jgi:8-oxo-dGTP pyrophosphatase MutT (NUDIX family)